MSCEPLLEWTSFPFAERPLTSFLLVIFLVLLSFLLWNVAIVHWGYPIFYYGGMLLTIGNLLPYFIASRYQLFDEGIVIRYLFIKVERKFADFGCFYLDKRGIMLSTFKTPRRLDTFRGQSLRFSFKQQEKEELIRILQEKGLRKY
jgi:hypothetical protein